MRGRTESYVYFLAPIGGGRIKIGSSVQPTRRLVAIASWSPVPLEIVTTAPGTGRDEMHIHGLLKEAWSHSEWFEPSSALLDLIEHVRRTGELPAYAKAPPKGSIRNFRAFGKKKPSLTRTPEWRAQHGEAIRRGYARRKAAQSINVMAEP